MDCQSREREPIDTRAKVMGVTERACAGRDSCEATGVPVKERDTRTGWQGRLRACTCECVYVYECVCVCVFVRGGEWG